MPIAESGTTQAGKLRFIRFDLDHDQVAALRRSDDGLNIPDLQRGSGLRRGLVVVSAGGIQEIGRLALGFHVVRLRLVLNAGKSTGICGFGIRIRVR